MTKQEQLNWTKGIFDALNEVQEEVPGRYFKKLNELKRAVQILNNDLAQEAQKAQAKEVVPEKNGKAPNVDEALLKDAVGADA